MPPGEAGRTLQLQPSASSVARLSGFRYRDVRQQAIGALGGNGFIRLNELFGNGCVNFDKLQGRLSELWHTYSDISQDPLRSQLLTMQGLFRQVQLGYMPQARADFWTWQNYKWTVIGGIKTGYQAQGWWHC